jgi:hypothetical protein
MTDRRFSDEEFAQVLHAALRLQEKGAPKQLGSGEGLTLEEMKTAARDAGIDPALIERAVAMLPAEELSSGGRIMGGPTRYRLARSIPGPVEREDLVRAVDAIRETVGLAGQVTSELDGLSWETKGEPSQLHVSIFPEDDGTQVRLAVNRDAAAVLTIFMPIMGSLVLGGITGGAVDPATAVGGVAIMGGWLAGGVTLSRVLWGRSTRIIRDRANRVLDAVTRALEGD